MPRKSAKKCLENVVCCVETKNDDGSDASKQTAKVLQELGAQVESGGIRMGLTHMIWSNGNIKMVKAAEFMDVIVVSPLWVEQCRESGKRVPEEGFIVSPSDPTSTKKVLHVPVSNVADEFEEPHMFSSSQRIMANESKGKEKEKRSGKRAGVISKKKSAPMREPTMTSDTYVEKENNEDTKVDKAKTPPGKSNKKTAPMSKGQKYVEGSNGSSKDKKKGSPAASSHVGVAAHSSPPSSTDADLTPESTKQTLKRRRMTSKQNSPIDKDSDAGGKDVKDSSYEPPTKKAKDTVNKSTPETTSLAASASSSKKAKEVPKPANIASPSVKKRLASAKNTSGDKSKITRRPESKPQSSVNEKSSSHSSKKSVASTTTTGGINSSSAVLSVSGFNHDERGLLEDIIVSLISKNPKNKTKSKSKGAGVVQERQVTLQQADPQMELQLIKALGSVTHVVTPDEAAHSNRTLRIIFAMARGVPVLTPAWVYACLDRCKWVWSPTDYKEFLHPRFNPRFQLNENSTSDETPPPVPVYVGKCDDPSKRLVEALVDCFPHTVRATSLGAAALVVMRNPIELESTILIKSDKRTNQHATMLEEHGRIISCKDFFDHIEHNSFPSSGIMKPLPPTSSMISPSVAVEAKSPNRNIKPGKNCSSTRNTAQKPAPHVAVLDEDGESEEMLLVPPHRGGKVKASRITTPASSKKRKVGVSSSSKSSNSVVSKKVIARVADDMSVDSCDDTMDDTQGDDADYTHCLVTSPAVSVPGKAGGRNVAVTLEESSESPSGSEMSFQVGEPHSPPLSKRGASSGRRWLAVDDEEEEEEVEETARSSYLSEEGSPCW